MAEAYIIQKQKRHLNIFVDPLTLFTNISVEKRCWAVGYFYLSEYISVPSLFYLGISI